MGTVGNLELRLHEKTLYASTTHDGYAVYSLAPKLVEFLDSVRNPSREQFETWFRDTSKSLIPYNYSEELTGGVPCEVIIDVPRRLLLHTPEDELQASFQNACIILEAKYNYQILEYDQPEMRSSRRSSGSE